MNKYDILKADMTAALKAGDKERRLTLWRILSQQLIKLLLLAKPEQKSPMHLLMKC